MTLTLEDILTHAAEAMVEAAHSKHLTDSDVLLIASRSVRESIEEAGRDLSEIMPALLDGAVSTLIGRCWEARERRQQLDIFEEFEAMGRVFERAQYLGDRNATSSTVG